MMSNHFGEIELRDNLLDWRLEFDWRRWFRCTVKILVVTDASGSFDTAAGFGLGKVLDIVAADEWPHVVFDFTTAHRGATAADKTNFRFDDENLAQYHQIWLFGVARNGPTISESELRALSEFMDNGGGVFATGDHQDLGVDLCAEVPRVRSMRRWYWPNPGPNGEPVAPDQVGNDRHDTLTDDPTTPAVEASQTDKIPQEIRPKLYSGLYPGGIFGRIARYPHPVLCGPNGPIEHLPDHMHEGLIEVPGNLANSFDFDGYTAVEYPTAGGFQEPPKVIANATNFVDGSEFGVLGAYNGHSMGVGRVVVDATWHHWFNINMNPYINATTPGHPTYDPAIEPKWEEIKAYFRNVAAWLSPPNIQTCLRNGGWLFTLGYYDIVITLRDLRRVPDSFTYFWQLGVFAKDALGRLASQCQTTEWIFDWLVLPELPELRLPWDPRPPFPDPPPLPFMDIDDLSSVVLGGAIHALAEAVGERDEGTITKLLENDDAVGDITMRGGRLALEKVGERYRQSCEWFERGPAKKQAE